MRDGRDTTAVVADVLARAELGEPVRRLLALAENARAFVDRQCEQADVVGLRLLEPVGEHVGAGEHHRRA